MQKFMVEVNLAMEGQHPYASKPYTWILGWKPVLYYYDVMDMNVKAILALGNAFAWIPPLFFMVKVGERREGVMIILWFLLTYLCYMPLMRVEFIYYMLLVTPPIYLSPALAFKNWRKSSIECTLLFSWFLLAVVSSLMFLPLALGISVPYEYLQRIWIVKKALWP